MFKLAFKLIREKYHKHRKVINSILFAAAVIMVAGTVVICSMNYKKAAAYEEEAKKVSQQCEEYKNDTEKLQSLIDGNGFDEYCERIAREKYGYAKPGEYVIYNSANEK